MKSNDVNIKVARFCTTNMIMHVNFIYIKPRTFWSRRTLMNPNLKNLNEMMFVEWLFDFFEGYQSLWVQKTIGQEFLSKESKNHDNQVRVHTWKNENRKRCKRVSSCCFLIVWAPTACMEAVWMVCTSWIKLEFSNQVHLYTLKHGNWKSG